MIIHVLKDGTEVQDIDGHIVRVSDNHEVYEVVKKIEN